MADDAQAGDTTARPQTRSRIILVGNEKGGSGKTTTAIHLIVGILKAGKRVASVDLDARQRSLTRYLQNRERFRAKSGLELALPHHVTLPRDQADDVDANLDRAEAWLSENVGRLLAEHEFLIVDTPGYHTPLSHIAHPLADVLVTPLNDSLLDLDVLGTVDGDDLDSIAPSHYADAVNGFRREREAVGLPATEWLVMRNRLSTLASHNNVTVGRLLDRLSAAVGFRLIGGVGERVIYRELFPVGLTLLDLPDLPGFEDLTASRIAALREMNAVLDIIVAA